MRIVGSLRAPPPPNMARVLIVDDDESARLFARHILESAGHELYFAKNGEEAMRLFLRNSPEVVVTDLQMPRGDGFELIEALTGMYPDVQIVAVSGKSPELISTAKVIGARATLQKPFSPRALLDAVAEASSAATGS